MDIALLDKIEVIFTITILGLLSILPIIFIILILVTGEISFIIPLSTDFAVAGFLIWKMEK